MEGYISSNQSYPVPHAPKEQRNLRPLIGIAFLALIAVTLYVCGGGGNGWLG